MNIATTASATESTGSNNSGNVSNNPQAPQTVDDMFLTLLVAQIQNQDPLNPTDSSEYITQLAQLSQVQAMETMAQLTANNMVLMDNLQTLVTGGLVGEEVMVKTDGFTTDGETSIKGRLTLEHPAGNVTVIVKDTAGTEHKIELGPQEAGQVDFNIDPAEMGLPEGKYTVSVVTDINEETIPVELGGKVTNVRIPLDGSATVLDIDGIGEVAYHDITQFSESPAEDDSSSA